jgi:cytochrome b pre-mRNA-processing protein 3
MEFAMYSALQKWFIPKPPAEAQATYIALVAAARNPFFYTELAVPDTLDGRFDLIVLHLFLLQHRVLFIEEDLVADPRRTRLA